jgi:hypothetical protein
VIRPLPAALQRRSDRDAIFEDIEPYLGTTVEERSRILGELCRLAAEQVAAHRDGQRILDYQDPRSRASLRLWQALSARSRGP